MYVITTRNPDGSNQPAAFALLPSKQKKTYAKMWSILHEHCPDASPKHLVVDMEMPAIISFLQEFSPDIKV